MLESGLESTFEYLFMPSETFNGRPMGLVVLINYRNNVKQKKYFFVVVKLGLFRKENDFKMLFLIKQLISSMPRKDLMVKRKMIN